MPDRSDRMLAPRREPWQDARGAVDGVMRKRSAPARDNEGPDRLRCSDADSARSSGQRLEPFPQAEYVIAARSKDEDAPAADHDRRLGRVAHGVSREQAGIRKERRAREIVEKEEIEIVGKHRPIEVPV